MKFSPAPPLPILLALVGTLTCCDAVFADYDPELPAPGVSYYRLSVDHQIVSDSSGLTGAGGDVVFSYRLYAGPEVPGLGSSIPMTFHWSALPGGQQWALGGSDAYFYTLRVDIPSFFENLPANNTTAEIDDRDIADRTDYYQRQGLFKHLIEEGAIDPFGKFTVSSVNAPPTVEGYTMYDSGWGPNTGSGILTYLDDGTYETATSGWASVPDLPITSPYLDHIAHGDFLGYTYYAFSDGIHPSPYLDAAMTFSSISYAEFTYVPNAVPEPSGAVLGLAAGGLCFLRRRR